MHLSLDVLAEELAKQLEAVVEVDSYEERLGISGITADPMQAKENTLLVVDSKGVETLDGTPRHVLVVLKPNAERPLIKAPELGFIHTTHSLEEVYAEACDSMLSLSNWDSRVLEALAARQDVSTVLAIAAERLTNPIALFDSKGALVSYAGSITETAEHTIWRDVLLNHYSPIEFYTHDEQERIARDIRKPWPFVFTPLRDVSHRYLTRGIFIDGKSFGSVGMVDVNAPITRGQVALVELVSDRLRLALSMRLGSGPNENDTAYLLRSILNGNKADRNLVSYHIEKLGWGTNPTLWLLACESLNNEGEQLADSARMARLTHLLRGVPCIYYEKRVVTIIANDDPSSNDRLAELLQKLGMRAVVSDSFSAASDSRLAYEQCDLGLRVTANDTSIQPLVRFSDLFERVLVNAIDPLLDVRALCDQTVFSLSERGLDGDVERGKTLVRELHAYLMNGCNALLTAHQLYMHRNTLLYHISQIEGLLGFHLADVSTSKRLSLIVSCLVTMWR